MADYFWVGGDGSWDNSTSTNWSFTSGGVGGAGIPTTSDTVTFDSLSNPTDYFVGIFFGSCSDLSANGPLSGILTFTSGISLIVSGSLDFGPNVLSAYDSDIKFSSTSTGNTITSSGNTLTTGNCTFDGVGGEWSFSDNFSVGQITLKNGSLNTNNQTVTTSAISSQNQNTRDLSFGSSVINLSSTFPFDFNLVGLTFDAGTSQINMTSPFGIQFSTYSLTYYNVSFTNLSNFDNFIFSNAVFGPNVIFNDLSFLPPVSGIASVIFGDNVTVNGTFTSSGSDYSTRIFIRGNLLGSAVEISTVSYSPSFCDFRDITIDNPSSPVSGTSLGDCGGNFGITFDTPKTVYWNLAGSNNWASNAWASTSGGSTSSSNFPLAQDTAVFNNAGSITQVSIADSFQIGTIDCSSRTSSMNIDVQSSPSFYGDIIFSSSVSVSGTQTINLTSRTTQNITSSGVVFTTAINFSNVGSTIVLQDDLSVSGSGSIVSSGIFDANNKNVTLFDLQVNTTLNMGSGLWSLTGTGTVWSASQGTVNTGSANIILTDTSTSERDFDGGSNSYNKLTIGGSSGTSTLVMFGNATYSELSSTKTVAHTITFLDGTTTTIGLWSINGTPGNVVTINSFGSNFSLIKSGGGIVSANYLNISHSQASPSTTWYAVNSINSGNNTGWIFGEPPVVVLNGNFLMLF